MKVLPFEMPQMRTHAAMAPRQAVRQDDDDDQGRRAHHHGHHGDGGGIGALGQALKTTLGQLGLLGSGKDDEGGDDPAPTTGSTTTTITITITVTNGSAALQQQQQQAAQQASGTTAPAVTGTDTTATPAPAPAPAPASTPTTTPTPTMTAPAPASRHTIRSDVHALMHALFQAVRGQHGSDFASALGALATQASQGKAPDALQSAFDALTTDALGAAGEGDADRPTLQQFLQALQRNLGGGDDSSSDQPVGQLLAVQA